MSMQERESFITVNEIQIERSQPRTPEKNPNESQKAGLQSIISFYDTDEGNTSYKPVDHLSVRNILIVPYQSKLTSIKFPGKLNSDHEPTTLQPKQTPLTEKINKFTMFKAKEFPLLFKQKENPEKITEENLQAISLTKRHQDTI